jgi:hypothetical protein
MLTFKHAGGNYYRTSEVIYGRDYTVPAFKPYDEVTEAEVLAWVHASVDKDATEAALAAKIEADKNPTSAAGTPWG